MTIISLLLQNYGNPLLRYTARGVVSLERLQAEANGDLLYTFTVPMLRLALSERSSGDRRGERRHWHWYRGAHSP